MINTHNGNSTDVFDENVFKEAAEYAHSELDDLKSVRSKDDVISKSKNVSDNPAVIRKVSRYRDTEEDEQNMRDFCINNEKADSTNSRRASVLLRDVAYISREREPIVRVENPPKTDHLRLSNTEPRSILGLIHGANKVMNESDYVIKLQKNIDSKVRHLLLQRMNVTEKQYYSLSYEEMIQGLSLLVRPNTTNEFWMLMRDNLYCRGTYKKENYEEYYQHLLAYFEDYLLLFRLLSERNSINIPSLKDADFGLIKIMALHIDNDYFKQVKSTISKDRYTNISEFIEEFKKAMLSHYEAYLLFKGVPDAIIPQKGRDREAYNHTKSKYNSDNWKRKSDDHSKTKNVSFSSNRSSVERKLYNIDTDGSEDAEEFADDSAEDSISSEHLWRGVEVESETSGSSDDEMCDFDNDQDTDTRKSLNYVSDSLKKLREPVPKPKVCMNAAVYGKCYKESDARHAMEYSHDESDVEELAAKIYARLYERNSGVRPGPAVMKSNAKVNLLSTRDTRGLKQQDHKVA